MSNIRYYVKEILAYANLHRELIANVLLAAIYVVGLILIFRGYVKGESKLTRVGGAIIFFGTIARIIVINL